MKTLKSILALVVLVLGFWGLGVADPYLGSPIWKLLDMDNFDQMNPGRGRINGLRVLFSLVADPEKVKRDGPVKAETTSAPALSPEAAMEVKLKAVDGLFGAWECSNPPHTLTLNADGSFQQSLTFGGTGKMAGGLTFSHHTTCKAQGVWSFDGEYITQKVTKLTDVVNTGMKVHPPAAGSGEAQVKIPPVEQLRTLLPQEISRKIQASLAAKPLGGMATLSNKGELVLDGPRGATTYRRLAP